MFHYARIVIYNTKIYFVGVPGGGVDILVSGCCNDPT